MWRKLQKRVLAPLLRRHANDIPLRVWMVGCGTGEEAYALAILLSEQRRKAGKRVPIQIMATETDAKFLATAMAGIYPRSAIRKIGRRRERHFFSQHGQAVRVKRKIRKLVCFFHQSPFQDLPKGRVDLICCHHRLARLAGSQRDALLVQFHRALRDGGFLVFPHCKETHAVSNHLFSALSKTGQIFQRVEVAARADDNRRSGRRSPGSHGAVGKQLARASLAPPGNGHTSTAEAAQLVLRERERLARELHDSLGQQITAITMLATALYDKLRAASLPEAELAQKLLDDAEHANSQVRALLQGALPIEVDAQQLPQLLQELATHTESLHQIPCEVACEVSASTFDDFTAANLYLIAREAVHNAVKHARASHVRVLLQDAGQPVLQISDDGIGLAHQRHALTGCGIRIMRYRSETIGGNFAITPGPSGGTVVTCALEQQRDSRD